MKKYKNIGTIAIMATLIVGGKDHELILHPGSVCELPSDNKYVMRLVKQNHLQEVEEKVDTQLRPSIVVGQASVAQSESKSNPKSSS
jgi:hypothetical protein